MLLRHLLGGLAIAAMAGTISCDVPPSPEELGETSASASDGQHQLAPCPRVSLRDSPGWHHFPTRPLTALALARRTCRPGTCRLVLEPPALLR
jgi:hypothetical protein